MSHNIYNELIYQCKVFNLELQRNRLLQENFHISRNVENFALSLESQMNGQKYLSSHLFNNIEKNWFEEFNIFVKSLKESSHSKNLINSAYYIQGFLENFKLFLNQKSKANNTASGQDIIRHEDYYQSLFDVNLFGIKEEITNTNTDLEEIKNNISEITDSKKEYLEKSQNIDAKLESIKSHLGISQIELNQNLSNQVNDKIEKLFQLKIQTMQDIYDKTLSLNSEMAGKLISNDFSKSANREKLWAEGWRITSFLPLILLAFFIYYDLEKLITPSINSSTDYVKIFKAASIGFIALSLSAVFLRESSKHRIQQYYYENQSLKISSLSPLIAELEPEQRANVKQEVAKFLFSNEQKINISDDSSGAILGLTKILEKVIERK